MRKRKRLRVSEERLRGERDLWHWGHLFTLLPVALTFNRQSHDQLGIPTWFPILVLTFKHLSVTLGLHCDITVLSTVLYCYISASCQLRYL